MTTLSLFPDLFRRLRKCLPLLLVYSFGSNSIASTWRTNATLALLISLGLFQSLDPHWLLPIQLSHWALPRHRHSSTADTIRHFHGGYDWQHGHWGGRAHFLFWSSRSNWPSFSYTRFLLDSTTTHRILYSTNCASSPFQNFLRLRQQRGTLGHGTGPIMALSVQRNRRPTFSTWPGTTPTHATHRTIGEPSSKFPHDMSNIRFPLRQYCAHRFFAYQYSWVIEYGNIGNGTTQPHLQYSQRCQWSHRPVSRAQPSFVLCRAPGTGSSFPNTGCIELYWDDWGRPTSIDRPNILAVSLPKKDPASAGGVCVCTICIDVKLPASSLRS